jgi:phosphoglycolate phosphatase
MYDAVVYPGIPQALEDLIAAGCRLMVATAKPHVFARPIIEHFDLARHFAAIHGPELDGTNDSKTDLIAHIVERHRLNTGAVIMIGDREHDVNAATRNSIRTVGVTWGYGSTDELTAAGAAALCLSPQDLSQTALDLLGSLGKFTREISPPVQLSHR